MTTEPVESALRRRHDDVVWLLSQLAAAPSEAGTSGESAQRVVGEYLTSAGYEVRYTVDDPARMPITPNTQRRRRESRPST